MNTTKKLKMQLFGTFCLTDGVRVLDESAFRSKTLIRLLIYLLINRNQILTHQNLISVFWFNDSRNPESALMNQMHLIRGKLKAFGEEKFICTMRGAYYWNPEIEVETDYEQFEQLLQSWGDSACEEEKTRYCKKIIAAYGNNITEVVKGEDWLSARQLRYQTGYMDAVKTVCESLGIEARIEDFVVVCEKFHKKEITDDKVEHWVLKALRDEKKYDRIIAYLEKSRSLLDDEKEVQIPADMMESYQRFIQGTDESNLKSIKNTLVELPNSKENGAYLCGYEVFRSIYQMEARRIKRLGIAEYVVVFTLERIRKRKNDTRKDHLMAEGREKLEAVMKSSLRNGDVATHFNEVQSIVMLQTCDYESAVKVAERVEFNFQKQYKRRKLILSFEIEEIAAAS